MDCWPRKTISWIGDGQVMSCDRMIYTLHLQAMHSYNKRNISLHIYIYMCHVISYHIISYRIVSYCIILHDITLYCIILNYIALYCIVFILSYIVLYCIISDYLILYSTCIYIYIQNIKLYYIYIL
jgi:hypothetical protein